MILLTTGTQLPFPRLTRAMDTIAATCGETILAQIGPDSASYPHLDVHETLTPEVFETSFATARIVVAHAGIGTVLSAQRHVKPLIIMARRADLGEHRNNHQLATVQALSGRPGIHIAHDEATLTTLIHTPNLAPAEDRQGASYRALTDFLTRWIDAA